MYDLPHHKDQDEQVVRAFMQQHPFAFLTGSDAANRPVATQVPVFYEERDGRSYLSGHIMKNTLHHKAFLENEQVLAVFTASHAYVSATWYSNPNMASTWNYMSVHARGKIRFPGGNALEEILRKTSLHFENNNPQSPTVFDNLPVAFRERVMGAIAVFEIEVSEISHVFKLSQDRDEASFHNIIAKLREKGENEQFIAAEMEKRAKVLFPDKTA